MLSKFSNLFQIVADIWAQHYAIGGTNRELVNWLLYGSLFIIAISLLSLFCIWKKRLFSCFRLLSLSVACYVFGILASLKLPPLLPAKLNTPLLGIEQVDVFHYGLALCLLLAIESVLSIVLKLVNTFLIIAL